MNTYSALDATCNELKKSLNRFSQTMKDIRTSIEEPKTETKEQRNTRTANALLMRNGYDEEPRYKLEQWGVLDAETTDAVEAIIYELIDHRQDSHLHHCE